MNAGYSILSFKREQVGQFLRASEGHLAQPTALAVLTGTGAQMQEGFSVDGNTLTASLEHYEMDLRNTPRSATFYGQAERYQLSLKALEELASRALGARDAKS